MAPKSIPNTFAAFALFGVLFLGPQMSAASAAAAGKTALFRMDTSIRGSIEASALRQDRKHGAALAAQVARLLRWRGDIIRNVHPGDAMRIIYTKAPKAEGGPILHALHYEGSAITLHAYLHTDSGGIPRYFDDEGHLIEPVFLNSPIDYAQITETVQWGRGKRRHGGIDLKADAGTAITLPFDAKVSRINWSTRVNGLCVEIFYTSGPAKGHRARFLHLQEVDPSLKPGNRYAAGESIGSVGSTGRSSAPHLHYEIRDAKGKALSPLEIHGSERGSLQGADLSAFLKIQRAMAARLEKSRPDGSVLL